MKAYIDSDVLIWHLRGERKALNLLKRLRDNEKADLWIGAMQRAEVVFYMRPVEELATLLFHRVGLWPIESGSEVGKSLKDELEGLKRLAVNKNGLRD